LSSISLHLQFEFTPRSLQYSVLTIKLQKSLNGEWLLQFQF